MKRKANSQKGFTLIELIITITLISIVIIISTNMIRLTTQSHTMVMEEYDTQSAIRMAAENVNNIVRYSKAVFAVPEVYVSDTSKMDPGWDYFGVSDDGRRIVIYQYDADLDEHVEVVMVDEMENVEYELVFEQDPALGDALVTYSIVAYVLSQDEEGNWNRTSEKVVFESEVESINAMQVIDKGTAASPSVALAFRNDGQTQGEGRSQYATVSLVLDTSGSMSDYVDGKRRIQWLKESLGYTNNSNSYTGILDEFAKEDNIEVSLVPFSTTANYPNPTDNDDSGTHPYFTAKTDLASIKTAVNSLTATGGTNTGDGLRRAYYGHLNFDKAAAGYPDHAEQYDYMIILVDGMTTYESWLRDWEDEGEMVTEDVWVGNWWNGHWEEQTYWDSDWNYTWTESFLEDGPFNYNNSTPSGSQYSITTKSLRGNGNNIMSDNAYVEDVGELIKARGITTYVIGFASDITEGVEDIAEFVDAEDVYIYDDEFDLTEVFSKIANDIMADFWIITGPQIR